MKTRIIMGLGLLAALAACSTSTAYRQVNPDEALSYCDTQVRRSLDRLKGPNDSIDYSMMPRNITSTDTAWHCRKADKAEWCGGFWPGILWYDYEATGDTTIRRQAERFTESLEFLSTTPAFDHDLGFLIFCSYGNGYRLTGNEKYKQVILDTADSLATLYNPVVGTILSWPRNVGLYGGHNTIMDNMMNLEMLFWAANNGGRSELRDIAVKHAETTMKHHFRDDFSSYHVAVYDTLSGDFIKGVTHQGFADSSMWARGQSWAIYGFTMVYRETRDPKFLDFAQKVADIYLRRLPDDYIPYWDFDDPAIPDAPRDASAACVVASALLELKDYVEPDKAKVYNDAANRMLATLSTDEYMCTDGRSAFLKHSVGHMPAGTEVDASIIYADYYYIEALLRLKRAMEHTGQS